jgi:hypothetical protein
MLTLNGIIVQTYSYSLKVIVRFFIFKSLEIIGIPDGLQGLNPYEIFFSRGIIIFKNFTDIKEKECSRFLSML